MSSFVNTASSIFNNSTPLIFDNNAITSFPNIVIDSGNVLIGQNIISITIYHAYQVNNKWLLPSKAGLPQQWLEGGNRITYYHLQLPNYFKDNLIVNGLVMEGWDGKMPHETREYLWE